MSKSTKRYTRDYIVYIGHKDKYDGFRVNGKREIEVHVPERGWERADIFWSETSYARESGKLKRTVYAPSRFADIPEIYAAGHDLIFFIDTNTKDRIAVSCIFQCMPKTEINGDVVFNHHALYLRFFLSEPNNAEKIAISQLLQSMSTYSKPGQNFLIVTDHSIGNLDDFNAQRKPVYEDVYVPENTTLMYASADGTNKNDSILNRMICQCDAIAGKHLNDLLTSGSTTFGPASITKQQLTDIPTGWIFLDNA